MLGTGSLTIIVHRSVAVRRRVSASLAADGRRWIGVSRWREVESRLGAERVELVILQVAPADDPTVLETPARVRERLPDSRLIIIAPGDDPRVTRAALSVRAEDLLEEPFDEVELDRCLHDPGAARQADLSVAIDTVPGSRDSLTPLPGHSAFLDALAGLRALCRRHGDPLSLMMLDLDRFRECNERYCPAFGDHVLRWFARILENVCRRSDILARYQSDRFIVALPNATAMQGADLARRCRGAMLHEPVVFEDRPHEMTVSIGIVESTVGFIETEQQLIQRARIALEQAKQDGGNRTITWAELIGLQPKRGGLDQLTLQGVSHRIERIRQQLRCTCVESTRALVAAVEAKDPYTREHSLTVSTFAEAIGKRMKLHARMLETLRAAALLHDVGKIGVPDAILTKPGPLTEEEFDVIRRHPVTALEILGHVSFLADERPLILHHHERYDGHGYPAGLFGDQIPIGARVLAVADSLDAMFSPRSYKKAYGLDRVRSELASGAGRQFDPHVAEVALKWLDEAPDVIRTVSGASRC